MKSRPSLWLCFVVILSIFGAATPASAMPPTAESTLFKLGDRVHATSIAFDPDGGLWFVGYRYPYPLSSSETIVGRVASDGTLTEFVAPTEEEKFGTGSITLGPDGAMWFTEPKGDRVGRVSQAGETTYVGLPAGTSPMQIVTGADGDLWFTDQHNSRIGRLSPTGTLQEFPLDPGSGLHGIALGPDGNVWFTLSRADEIGKITPFGQVTLFPLRNRRLPLNITAGPGGLWFTEGSISKWGRNGTNRIGRITTSGRTRQFRVPAKFGTRAIVAGPDGNVWFSTGPRLGAIEWISSRGEVGPRSCLGDSCTLPPSDLAFAPDGVLWFGTSPYVCTYCGGETGVDTASESGFIGHLGA
jgi:virginiamycin B lyase